MNKKTFSTILFISCVAVLLFSILGLIMLNVNYLTVSTKTYVNYFETVTVSINYTGYQLIFDNVGVQVGAEPLLHFIGFVFFLVGSLIFVIISIINYFTKDESKKLGIKYDGISDKKKNLKILSIFSSIILGLIAVLVIVFGFLSVYSSLSSATYQTGSAKIIAAFLLAFNFLILAFVLDLIFYYVGSNLPKEEKVAAVEEAKK